MRVTTKGQVTIPQEFRERFGFYPYTEVEFYIKGDELVLRGITNTNRRGNDLIRRMTGKSTVKLSTDEIMQLTRSTEENEH